MDYIYIGKIVNTHGIKGELRLLSKFEYKEKVFLPNTKIYIGPSYKEETIANYRKHKMFDMITLNNYNNINHVLEFVNEKVYIKKETLVLEDNEILDSDLMGMTLISGNSKIGIVTGITTTGNNHKILETLINEKRVLIPYHKDFIISINKLKNTIEVKLIEGMII